MVQFYKDKQWTEYTWNWLPIGGFVRILWEDPTWPDALEEWSFMSRPWFSRVIVLIAWVTMNFFLAFIIFTGLFAFGAKPIAVNPLSDGPTHSFFLPSFEEAIEMWYVQHQWVEISSISWSIAELAGIEQEERVISINNTLIDSPDILIELVRNNSIIDILLLKDWIQRTVQLNPVGGKIGVMVGYHNLSVVNEYRKDLDISDAIIAGWVETYQSSKMTLGFLSTMVQWIFAPDSPEQYEDAKNMLSGPIGVWATFVWLIEISAPISMILIVIALISINLWVVNLLPIPALDGGRIITTTLYSIVVQVFHAWTERFLQFEKYFHAIGFILLLALTFYIAWLDISRFF